MELIDFVILFVFLCGALFVWDRSRKKKGKPGVVMTAQESWDRAVARWRREGPGDPPYKEKH